MKPEEKIIEAIYEITAQTMFKEDGRKYLDKILKNKNIELDKNNGTIKIQNRDGTKTLYTLTITK
jgi:hypothetical protein